MQPADGNYYTVADVPVPFDVKPGTSCDVSATVSGTAGLREFTRAAADFSGLTVTGLTGTMLYRIR